MIARLFLFQQLLHRLFEIEILGPMIHALAYLIIICRSATKCRVTHVHANVKVWISYVERKLSNI